MRPVAKTIAYGVVHLGMSIAVAYLLTRDWWVSLGIGIVVPLVQVAVHFLHDRFRAQRDGGASGDGKDAGRPCMAL